MPNQTFFNLPEDKRNSLLAIAIEEFADNDYSAASVSRIVERAGIAKGSIYQYSNDKQEMFVYLVEEASRRLLSDMVVGLTAAEDEDFFTHLRGQMRDTIRVNLANPQLSRLLLRSTQAPVAVREAMMKRLSVLSGDHLFQLVHYGIERGDLRAGLDPALVTTMLNGLFRELGSYIMIKLNLDLDQADAIDVKSFDSPVVEEVYDAVIEILRNGLSK